MEQKVNEGARQRVNSPLGGADAACPPARAEGLKNLCKNLVYVSNFRRTQRIALTSSQASLLLVVCS